MTYIYIDESGDLGFDFKNKSPSDYFTITLIVVRDIKSNKQLRKEIETTIKRKINTKKKSKRLAKEIKGSKTDLNIKKYLYKRIEMLDFDIYSITFNKRNVYENLKREKHRLYNYFVRLLIDEINLHFIDDQLTIILDKSKNTKQIKDCNDYLIRNLEIKIPLDVSIDIIHENSETIKQIQLADVFCYGFFEKYNKKDTSWLDVYKDKVVFDKLYFE